MLADSREMPSPTDELMLLQATSAGKSSAGAAAYRAQCARGLR